MSKYQMYDTITQIYTSSGNVEMQPLCNGYTVTNTGNDIVTVDDKILYPGTVGTSLGDSFVVGGNACEVIARKQIKIQFAAVTGPAVEITQKYFIN
jgi:hypothetical protein